MSEAIVTVFKDILIGSNCNVCLKYWYRVLNVNSYRLNREGYEGDQMKLFNISSNKNPLSDEEKAAMLKKGFNDKYRVSNYNVPFEELKLNGPIEWVLYLGFLFIVGCLLRFSIGRSLTRTIIRRAMRKTNSIRTAKIEELKKLQTKRTEFSECPFTGTISTKDDPAFYTVFDEIQGV